MGRSVIYRGIILEKEIEKNVYMSVPRNYCAAASITNRFLIVYRISWRVIVLLTYNADNQVKLTESKYQVT